MLGVPDKLRNGLSATSTVRREMTVIISMLRGVNVGGHNKIKMDALRAEGREIYIYFPNGAGRSKPPWAGLGKMLKTQGTGRNWNSVRKMLEMAEKMGGSK